jgi:6-phosphogluconolactonase (cycloisomerase 2 family)
MPHALYVCLQDENKIAVFAMNADTGELTPRNPIPAAGGPSVLAISPDRRVLYVGHRIAPAISSFRIDHDTGGLAPQGTVATEHAPTFLAPDRNGRYLLSAYYQGGGATAHPLAADGAVGLHRSIGWRLRRGLTPSRPTRPTGLPLFRTLLV